MRSIVKKTENHAAKSRLAAYMAMFLLLANFAYAAVELDMPYSSNEKLVLIRFDSNWKMDNIKVVRDNYFYRNNDPYDLAFFDEDAGDEEDYPYYMELIDTEGNVLMSTEFYSSYIPMPYFSNLSKIKVYDTYEGVYDVVDEKDITFCNNNGICEACGKGYCDVMESSATCADCRSGSKDSYCDLKKDGVCDPDCNGIDMDCPGCTEEKCYYEDSIDQDRMCGRNGEEICAMFDECAGNVVGYTENGYCCDGNCVDPTTDEEYAEQEPVEVEFTGGSDYVDESEDVIMNPVELFNMNYNNSIPVEDESNKILCSNVGKSVCGQFEECTGQRVYSDDEGEDCCTGYCAPVSDKQFRQEYKGIFGEDYNPSLEKAKPQKGLAQYIPLPAVEMPAIVKASPWWLLLVALALLGIILLYNFERKKGSEAAKRIENEYSYYKNYGYNDEQIKTILAQRGWEKKDIKKVMKK